MSGRLLCRLVLRVSASVRTRPMEMITHVRTDAWVRIPPGAPRFGSVYSAVWNGHSASLV
jgi:hypothetical protein